MSLFPSVIRRASRRRAYDHEGVCPGQPSSQAHRLETPAKESDVTHKAVVPGGVGHAQDRRQQLPAWALCFSIS